MELLLRNWKSHVIAGLAIAIMAALGSLFMADRFESVTHLMPAEKSSPLGNLGGMTSIAADLGVSSLSEGDTSYLIEEVLNSRWMQIRLLDTSYTFPSRSWRFGKVQIKHKTLFETMEVKNHDLALMRMVKIFKVKRDNKTKLITITTTASSPELAQGIANKALELLQMFLLNNMQTPSRYKVHVTGERLKEAIQSEAESEERLKTFAYSNQNYAQSADPAIRLKGKRLEADLALRQQVKSTLFMSNEMALLNQTDDTPQVTVLDEPSFPEQKTGPWRAMIVVVGLVLGAAASFVWIEQDRLKLHFQNLSGTRTQEDDSAEKV
jgi:uncharacterized protein involved in exopolysaccharide biosynthesis